jgi:DNA-binding response OmpR family regulator
MTGVRILLVEDDADITNVLQRGLQSEGYRVDTVASGREAITRTREQDYRLIVLDLILPDLDGMEVCRKLRHEQYQALILMLTARDGLNDKIEGYASGQTTTLLNRSPLRDFSCGSRHCSDAVITGASKRCSGSVT